MRKLCNLQSHSQQRGQDRVHLSGPDTCSALQAPPKKMGERPYFRERPLLETGLDGKLTWAGVWQQSSGSPVWPPARARCSGDQMVLSLDTETLRSAGKANHPSVRGQV